MHLDELEPEVKRDIEAFFLWYRLENKKHPETYPLEMTRNQFWEIINDCAPGCRKERLEGC